MPRYRVTLQRTAVEIVDAANPYQAAIVANSLSDDDVEVESVVPAVGRPPVTAARTAAKARKTTVKKAAKKRRPMSAETRAKLAKNLIKARAARAAKAKTAKRTTKKAASAKKSKRVATKR